MSSCFEGNAYIDGGASLNIEVSLSTIGSSHISTSSLDMLNTNGQLQNITNVADPIQRQDAATKYYVDALGIVLTNVDLFNTTPTIISNNLKGSFVITISNLVLNGPCAVFHVTKSEPSFNAHITRTVAAPGFNSKEFLNISWAPNSGILLNKTGNIYNGSYLVKIM